MKRAEAIKMVQKRLRKSPKRLIELKEWTTDERKYYRCPWHVVEGEGMEICSAFCGTIFPKLYSEYADMCPCHHYTIETVRKVAKQILAGV
jgi:hypothetical protein